MSRGTARSNSINRFGGKTNKKKAEERGEEIARQNIKRYVTVHVGER